MQVLATSTSRLRTTSKPPKPRGKRGNAERPTFWRVGEAGVSGGGQGRNGRPSVGPDESPYAAAVRALLEDGPMQGKTVEVEAVESRPPLTIDVPDEKGGACRYCLAQLSQEGMTAAYTFLYAV